MTDNLRVDDGHRRWAEVDRGASRPADRPAPGKTTASTDVPHPAVGSGVLQADLIRTLAAIEVPPKEDVWPSVAWVSERISGEAGAGLVAQANVQPPRALALLTDER